MSPRTMSPVAIEAMISVCIAAALASYEAIRQQSQEQGGSSGGNGVNPRPYNYQDFLSCKPNSFFWIGGVIELTHWVEETESVFAISSCTAECKVKFAACTFMGSALTWWNRHVQVMGLPAINALTWEELKMMLLAEYYPRSEVRKLEQEFWNLSMKGFDIQAYNTRFTELAVLCPGMVNPEYKKVERYIWGLAPHIESIEISAKPATFESAKAFSVTTHGRRHSSRNYGATGRDSQGVKQQKEILDTTNFPKETKSGDRVRRRNINQHSSTEIVPWKPPKMQ